MNFELINVDEPENEKEYDEKEYDKNEDDNDDDNDDTYRTLHAIEQQPILTSIDKKRAKRTAECQECHKMVSKKTLEYSHKCSVPKLEQTPPPTEESLYEYIVAQEKKTRLQQLQRKQEQFDKITNFIF